MTNQKIAKIGANIILLMMMFVVINNVLVISGSAVQFNAPSGTSGTVANGNGYFDNENTIFNLSEPRNIFVVAEPNSISILEPLGYPLGSSGAYTIMSKGNNSIKFAMVASDGFLYYVDGDGIKKKTLRSTTSNPVANNTGIGGTSLLIYASASIMQLSEYNGNIYFFDYRTIKRFDESTLQVTTYALTEPACSAADTVKSASLDFAATGDIFIAAVMDKTGNSYTCDFRYNGSSLSPWNIYTSYPTYAYSTPSGKSTIVVTPHYIYTNQWATGSTVSFGAEKVFYLNGTLKYTDNYITGLNYANFVYVGGYSTTALYSNSGTTYNVFNFIEPGILNVYSPTNPAALTYTDAYVYSTYRTYYQNAQMDIKYGLNFSVPYTQFDLQIFDNILKYTYRIDLIAPDGGNLKTFDVGIVCEQPGAFDIIFHPEKLYACKSTGSSFKFTPPLTNWTPGTYNIDLIETTRLNGSDARLAQDSVIVTNTSKPAVGIVSPDVGTAGSGTNIGLTGTINFLGSTAFIAILILTGFISVGAIYGGAPGLIVALFGSIPILYLGGLIPLWIVFLEAAVVFLGMSVIGIGYVTKGKGGN